MTLWVCSAGDVRRGGGGGIVTMMIPMYSIAVLEWMTFEIAVESFLRL